jgi:hypothetical protein
LNLKTLCSNCFQPTDLAEIALPTSRGASAMSQFGAIQLQSQTMKMLLLLVVETPRYRGIFERDPIPYALETDWPVGAAGFETSASRNQIC